MTVEFVIIAFSVIVLLSVLLSKVSQRFGIPVLLLFLVLGMLAGSEGLGGIYFDDPVLTQWIAAITLPVILFTGGIDTEWKKVRPVIKEGITLATLGVLLTALAVGVFCHYLLKIPWLEGLLIGSIISATDAPAVFSVLRSQGVGLKGRLTPLLELESGSNDPMAIFLTISLVQLISNQLGDPVQLVPLFILQMGIGAVIGWLMSRISLYLINRLKLGYEGLYPVLSFALLFATFGITTVLKGSGYLAVYILGLLLGREDFLHKRSLLRFFDGNAWLMQIALFVTLGLLVFPSQVLPVIPNGLLLAVFLMIIARPLAVFLTLLPFRYSIREMTLVSWVGLKGAVPIVLATFPLVAGIQSADLIFNLVFFVVISSVLFQGTSLPLIAKWLHLDHPILENQPFPFELLSGYGLKGELRKINILDKSIAAGKAVYQLGLPPEYLIILIQRGDQYIQPNGSIVLRSGDVLLSLSEESAYETAVMILSNQDGEDSTPSQPSLPF